MNGSPPQLFSTLMILKAACLHNHCYIDRLITTFMKVLTKMAREHLAPTTTDTNSGNIIMRLVARNLSSGFLNRLHSNWALQQLISAADLGLCFSQRQNSRFMTWLILSKDVVLIVIKGVFQIDID